MVGNHVGNFLASGGREGTKPPPPDPRRPLRKTAVPSVVLANRRRRKHRWCRLNLWVAGFVSLCANENQPSQSEDGRVFGDQVLDPFLRKFRMKPNRHSFWSDIVQRHWFRTCRPSARRNSGSRRGAKRDTRWLSPIWWITSLKSCPVAPAERDGCRVDRSGHRRRRPS
jgi:hypothetical protein